jgi:hypothetical protein
MREKKKSSRKSQRSRRVTIPFIKNACNNFDEKEIETTTKDRN